MLISGKTIPGYFLFACIFDIARGFKKKIFSMPRNCRRFTDFGLIAFAAGGHRKIIIFEVGAEYSSANTILDFVVILIE